MPNANTWIDDIESVYAIVMGTRWTGFIVVTLLLVTPCRATLTPGLSSGVAITFDSIARTYDLYVPPSYTGGTPYPLLLDFHGYSTGSTVQQAISGLKTVADNEGFIIAYPQGYGASGTESWNAGGCCDPALAAAINDVGFAKAVAADIVAQGNIDQQRIYATGHSNGSMMAQRLACDAGDVFAAVAGVAAPVLFQSAAPPCVPARPMPVLHFAGLDDTIVPYAGGATAVFPAVVVESAANNFLHWRTAGGCTSSTPDAVETFPTGGSCETYSVCSAGVQVSLCSLHGSDALKHFAGLSYPNTEGVLIGQRIWDFVSQFSLPGSCGDGVVAGGESCDDGGVSPGDGCDASCQVEPGWSCSGQPSVCTNTCGNGATGTGETCDDGGTTPGDGCDANCQVEPGWSCSGQPSVCTTTCGDGVVVGAETCDDGNVVTNDGCSDTCQIEAGCSCSGTPSVCACIIPIVPRKLVIIDTLTAKGKAKVVFLAKDAAVRKGFGTDPSTIQAQLTVAFSNGASAGTFSLPAGDPGWISNQGTVAKFLNRNAPAGSTVTKVSTLKPGSLVKLVAKGLGDAPLDLVGAGDPAGPVWTAYCVTNAGQQICMCSSLTDCAYKPIAGGAGAKLLCHTGVGDAACQALAP